jgi:hypothetical protein
MLGLLFLVMQPAPQPYSLAAVREKRREVGQLVRIVTWPLRAGLRRIAEMSIWRCEMAEQMIFGGVRRALINDAITALSQRGVIIAASDVGVSEFNGPMGRYRVSWSYNEEAQEMTLILERKPFLVPMSKIRSKVKELLAEKGIYEVA